MEEHPSDQRSNTAKAYQLASKVTSICIQTVLPMVIGYWFDEWSGRTPLFTVCGLVLGMLMGTISFINFVRQLSVSTKNSAQGHRSEDGHR